MRKISFFVIFVIAGCHLPRPDIKLGDNYCIEPESMILFEDNYDISNGSIIDYVYNDDFIITYDKIRYDNHFIDSHFMFVDKSSKFKYHAYGLSQYVSLRLFLSIPNNLEFDFWSDNTEISKMYREKLYNDYIYKRANNGKQILEFLLPLYLKVKNYSKAISCCNNLIFLEIDNYKHYINLSRIYSTYLNDIDLAIITLQNYRKNEFPFSDELDKLYYELVHKRNED